MAAKVNLNEAIVGDSLNFPIKIVDDNKNPIDISGRTFWITLKANPTVDDDQADAQTEYLAPANASSQAGELGLPLSKEQTETLRPISYNYDIQMKTPTAEGDEIRTILYGRIRFVQQITRSS